MEERCRQKEEGERGQGRKEGGNREEGLAEQTRDAGRGRRPEVERGCRGWAACTFAACLALVSCCHTSSPTSRACCLRACCISCTAPRCAAAEAVQMANNTQYGLAAYFFTQDLSRAWRVAERLEYGMVGVNEVAITSEVRLPGSRVRGWQARVVRSGAGRAK